MSSRDWIVVGVGALLVALSAAGSFLLASSWWGLALWSFLPAWSFLLATVAVIAGTAMIVLLGRSRARSERAAVNRPRRDGVPAGSQGPGGGDPAAVSIEAGREPRWPVFIVAPAFCFVAWIFRVRHLLLGDGIPLVQHLATGLAFHPREPLTYWIQAALFRLMNSIAPAATPELTAARGVAAGAITAGALFVFVAWGLAGEILRRWRDGEPPTAAPDRGPDPDRLPARILLALVLLSQGYALLFFGYVENYAFLVTAAAFTLLAGLRAARGAWPVWAPGVAAVVATALHISGALLFPAWLLVVASRARSSRRGALITGVVVTALAFGAAMLMLGRMEKGYDWVQTILTVGRVTTTSGIKGVNRTYLGSADHFRDFFNEHWLLGPLALFLLIPAAGRFLIMKSRRVTAGDLFIGVNALLWFLAVSRIADSNLGYARDWDLQSAAGICFAVSGLYLLVRRGPRSLSDARLLAIALLVSSFQFVPWVALNASADTAVLRAARLPLGHGRSEVLVGTWYQREHRLDEAEEWYRKALRVAPESHPAWCGLGSIAFEKKQYERAARLFGIAVKLKPEFVPYRESLVSSLMHEGSNEQALREFVALLAVDPRNATTWAQYANLLGATGRVAAAREAVQKALEVDPSNVLARKVEEELKTAAPDSLTANPGQRLKGNRPAD